MALENDEVRPGDHPPLAALPLPPQNCPRARTNIFRNDTIIKFSSNLHDEAVTAVKVAVATFRLIFEVVGNPAPFRRIDSMN